MDGNDASRMEDSFTAGASQFDRHATHWLSRYSGHTRDAAEKEVRRFALWCAALGYDPLAVASPQAQQYLEFLRDPQPAEHWVGRAALRLLTDGSPNPAWRPFAGPLAASSIRLARSHLNGLFGYLRAEGIAERNPFHATRVLAQLRRRETHVEKSLTAEAVTHLMRFLANLPGHTARQARKKAFYQLLIELFLATGVRRFEVGTLSRADLQRGADGIWLRVHGKGNVLADIPVPEQLLTALERYDAACRALGLPVEADGPLLPGRAGQRSGSGVYRLVRSILQAAAQTAPPEVGDELQRATPHWMRHTYAQRLVDAGVPLDVVRDNLRHASLATTSKYLRSSRARRQTETVGRAGGLWHASPSPDKTKTTERLGRLEESGDELPSASVPDTAHRR
jgi:integrase